MSPVLWSYIFIAFAGVVATEIWRWLGVLVGNRLSEDSEAMIWVRCVATALIAAVIAKLILNPTGVLAEVPALIRAGAALSGFAVYILSGQRILAGVAVAVLLISAALAYTA